MPYKDIEKQREYLKIYRKKFRKQLGTYFKEYTKKNTSYFKNYYKEYYKDADNKNKQLVRYILNTAVRKGEIKKPKICVNCKEVKKLDAHHTDYSKPLEVVWLCRICHKGLHNL